MIVMEYKEQIEDLLGRALGPDELISVRTLDELTDAHVAVVESLAPRHVILPLHYLRAVVPNASLSEIREYSDRIARRVREDTPERASDASSAGDLPNIQLFERYLGRPLEPAEKLKVAALTDLSSAHLAVASALFHAEAPVGLMYLQRIVPTSSLAERSQLAAELTRR